MPRILINEEDRTSPGTPSDYANYSVLIAGFSEFTEEQRKERAQNRTAQAADSNGVYEFTSRDAFVNTIGCVDPAGADGNYHYGNQMAYELLGMGYTVIYKVIDNDKIANLGTGQFWEVFKDKASYDFRFVTHGLLESSEPTDSKEYNNAVNHLKEVEEALAELGRIETEISAETLNLGTSANTETEVALARTEEYKSVRSNFAGFIKSTSAKNTTYYESYATASEGLLAEKEELEKEIETATDGLITTALINQANNRIAELAQYKEPSNNRDIPGRGDCTALIELDEKKYKDEQLHPEEAIITAINEVGLDTGNLGQFCALTVPSVYYSLTVDEAYNENTKFPGAFHYLACFNHSLGSGFAEWYAAAGYTRGVSKYTIDHATVTLGEIAINALEPRYSEDNLYTYPKFSCNVIANFRGSYYLWGNRTAYTIGSASGGNDLVARHFLNIRQLCTTIKKQLYVACRSFTFDPNSDTLWINFCNRIRPTLERMKADQGIRDYKILKVPTDKKATLKAKIRIIPIEAVEDFDLTISLEDSFGETTAVVTE